MPARRTDIDDSDVQYMYEVDGMTLREISDYYGVSLQCIWCRLHPEKHKESSRKWMLENPEYIKEYDKQHYQVVRDKRLEQVKEYQLKNPGMKKICNDKFQLLHPEYFKEWRHSEKGKIYMRRHNAMHRSLGSIELNKPFDGSEGHHIDDTYIIHMPKELHKSIYHNVFTGQGMEDINTIAFQYITEEVFDKLIAGEV